jgi:type II secretory pathway pseudopilin PulG
MKKQKAFGLVEIIISLAVFGTAIIATMSLTVRSYVTVKNNELGDLANSIMISSSEYFKSPNAKTILPAAGTSGSFYFNLTSPININPGTQTVTNLSFNRQTQTSQKINTCDSGSAYKVAFTNTTGLPNNFILCNQVIIQPQADGSYMILSEVVFNTSKGLDQSELIGYRLP